MVGLSVGGGRLRRVEYEEGSFRDLREKQQFHLAHGDTELAERVVRHLNKKQGKEYEKWVVKAAIASIDPRVEGLHPEAARSLLTPSQQARFDRTMAHRNGEPSPKEKSKPVVEDSGPKGVMNVMTSVRAAHRQAGTVNRTNKRIRETVDRNAEMAGAGITATLLVVGLAVGALIERCDSEEPSQEQEEVDMGLIPSF